MTMKLQRTEKISTGLFWSSSCWFSPILYSMTRIPARNTTAMAERQRRIHVGINTICGGEGEREIRGWATNGSVEMLSTSVMGCTSGKGRVNNCMAVGASQTPVWLPVPQSRTPQNGSLMMLISGDYILPPLYLFSTITVLKLRQYRCLYINLVWEEGRETGKEGGVFQYSQWGNEKQSHKNAFSKIITTHSPPTTSRPLCPTECPETQAAVSLPWPAPPAVHNDITITSVRGWWF